MRMQTDRFETTLPKEHFFTRPPVPTRSAKRKSGWLGTLILGGISGMALMAIFHQSSQSPAGVSPAPTVAVPTPPPLPDPTVARALPVGVATAPRAHLVHIRALGTYENDRMPDGRVLNTLYKGELPAVANLPAHGGQPGDMWYTKNDGHCWVLAPIAAGSQTTGWVDP
jgi:hypothetical protein